MPASQNTGSTAGARGSVQLAGVGKRYAVERRTSVVETLRRAPAAERWALRDLDLHIEPGEAVGVLGHNGAGKTTLLRMLDGVTRPTEGRVRVHGRIAPLISVGVGFHQELSGRENAYLNGQLLGLSRAEVTRHLPSIVEFSELDGVLDTPVKFYSSGMLLRLAFSVLIHLEPDVMLVDEILAVGDVAFRAKCLAHLRSMWAGGTTLVLVSHAPNVIRALCPRAVVLHHGRLAFDGDADAAVWTHHDLLGRDSAVIADHAIAELTGTTLLDSTGQPRTVLEPDQRYRLHHRAIFHARVESPQVYFDVFDESGEVVYQCISTVGSRYRTFEAGEDADVTVDFVSRIGPGRYRMVTELRTLDARSVLCRDDAGLTVQRPPAAGVQGAAELAATIIVDGEACPPRSDHAIA